MFWPTPKILDLQKVQVYNRYLLQATNVLRNPTKRCACHAVCTSKLTSQKVLTSVPMGPGPIPFRICSEPVPGPSSVTRCDQGSFQRGGEAQSHFSSAINTEVPSKRPDESIVCPLLPASSACILTLPYTRHIASYRPWAHGQKYKLM